MKLNRRKCVKRTYLILIISFLITSCATKQMVIEIGDNEMSCEQLLIEIGESDKGRKKENKKAVVTGVATVGGAAVATTVAATATTAATAVASVVFLPIALVAGVGYAGLKASEAYQNEARMQHLTEIYNNKDCVSSVPTTRNQVSPNEMVKVQMALSEKGFDVGVVDGIYGKKTRDALTNFQQENGLMVTGKADPTTRDLLLK